ncbi:hypothetical protein [Paraburkholderia sp. GAS334]|jgi:hypothetical protein|uniref:hypothetical protein n=1 Tax=unclassified Paraburkholderia TaxID=2615204 RepID=UPI003D1CB097
MYLLITFAILEVIAVVVVASLCIAARRADERTERALTPDEISARRDAADVPRLATLASARGRAIGRWFNALVRDSRHDGSRS